MNLRNLVPWWARIGAKILLTRLPVSYSFWKRLGIFEHGEMNQPAQALETYLTHAQTAGFSTSLPSAEKDFTVLELGPGDSTFTALVARAMGATRVWLVDAGAFASTNPDDYGQMVAYLESQGYRVPITQKILNLDHMLRMLNATYLTDGIGSLNEIEDRSIDFCFSNAVLEHIPKKDFFLLSTELQRVLKCDGVCVHRVDLKDHLGGGLNNLRFSEQLWENPLFSHSGFYTNRLRLSKILKIFIDAGFECEIVRKITWDKLPIARSALAKEFQSFADEDLLVSGVDLVLRHGVKN